LKGNLPAGTQVFVAVAPGANQFFEVTRAGVTEFAPAPKETMLRGRSSYAWWNTSTNSVHIDYGIERFYVSEGTGQPTGKLTMQAVVPASGRARIKEVFVDGVPYAAAAKNFARPAE
jgi:uncharacterized membrane-anchored protein